jgi:hypothetical protein
MLHFTVCPVSLYAAAGSVPHESTLVRRGI